MLKWIFCLLLLGGCGLTGNNDNICNQTDCIVKGVWSNSILETKYVPEVKRCDDLLLACMKSCKNTNSIVDKCESDHESANAYCATLDGFPKSKIKGCFGQ